MLLLRIIYDSDVAGGSIFIEIYDESSEGQGVVAECEVLVGVEERGSECGSYC